MKKCAIEGCNNDASYKVGEIQFGFPRHGLSHEIEGKETISVEPGFVSKIAVPAIICRDHFLETKQFGHARGSITIIEENMKPLNINCKETTCKNP